MLTPTDVAIQACVRSLRAGYRRHFSSERPEYSQVLQVVAQRALSAIAYSDALYHTVEHTILVVQVGQAILHGKLKHGGTVTCEDWLHAMVALLCHDIGYVRGICQGDQVAERRFVTGQDQITYVLPAGATDASLMPYHVDRGRCYVAEALADIECIQLERVQQNIEFTRFPVPVDPLYQNTLNFPGLCRAADLIGQLSDPRYLQKLPALFQEFEETGMNRRLGYRTPGDLKAGYPYFYWHGVYPYIQDGLQFLGMTKTGRRIIARLYTNLYLAEFEQPA